MLSAGEMDPELIRRFFRGKKGPAFFIRIQIEPSVKLYDGGTDGDKEPYGRQNDDAPHDRGQNGLDNLGGGRMIRGLIQSAVQIAFHIVRRGIAWGNDGLSRYRLFGEHARKVPDESLVCAEISADRRDEKNKQRNDRGAYGGKIREQGASGSFGLSAAHGVFRL
jgi:hypothetical protein